MKGPNMVAFQNVVDTTCVDGIHTTSEETSRFAAAWHATTTWSRKAKRNVIHRSRKTLASVQSYDWAALGYSSLSFFFGAAAMGVYLFVCALLGLLSASLVLVAFEANLLLGIFALGLLVKLYLSALTAILLRTI